MYDPITALGTASNVVQLIDFGVKITLKAQEIHQSATGLSTADADLEIITKDLIAVNAQLYVSVGSSGDSESLARLCQRCVKTADELISALESFTVKGK